MIKANPFTAVCHAMALWVLPATLLLSACQSKKLSVDEAPVPAAATSMSAVNLRLSAPATEPSGGKRFDASSDPQIKDQLFAPDAENITVQIAVYSKAQKSWVYSKLTPFTKLKDGSYKVTNPIKVPTGECEFYALYVANPTAGTANAEYYTPAGQKQALSWDFKASAATDLPMEQVVNSVIPVALKENGGSYSLLEDKPVTVTPENTLTDDELNKVAWEDLTTHPWKEKPHKGALPHRSPLSGKAVVAVTRQTTNALQEVEIPLMRDYARLKLFIGTSITPTGSALVVEKIAFINMPTATAPLFRKIDDTLDKQYTANDKAGVYSYGYNFKYQTFGNFNVISGELKEAPKVDGTPTAVKMIENEKYEYILPQYVGGYIPSVNSWQAGQPHPKIFLRVRYYVSNIYRRTETVRDFLVDIGEPNKASDAFDGPLLPGRDYNVFLMLPESPEREIFLVVQPYGNPIEVTIPEFE